MNDLLMTISTSLEYTLVERRLIRLWPFAERRTRGNGALGAILEIGDHQKENLDSICRKWFSGLMNRIEKYPDSGTPPSPCLLISHDALPVEWYWDAVRGFVDSSYRMEQAVDRNCTIFHSDSNFGVVGACAAAAWKPSIESSWELIAWRKDELIGSQRMVSKEAVYGLAQNHPETFLNRDPTKDIGMIAPRTPCPVLYGIRGSSESVVSKAHHWLQDREDVESCLSFASHITNQLSDDHIPPPRSGAVTSTPEETRGGHSFLFAFTGKERIKLVAFSEGGPVNRLLRTLRPGDNISWSGLEAPDGSVHLEKLRLDFASPRIVGRPLCCSRTMRSAGRGQGLRCLSCGKVEGKHWKSTEAETPSGHLIGEWIEPTPSNRRHLSKPLAHGNPSASIISME
tara:strand:+ start:6082 stop:7278 length:1197 start_codon:yes stop_codon:yes gene_type:complete